MAIWLAAPRRVRAVAVRKKLEHQIEQLHHFGYFRFGHRLDDHEKTGQCAPRSGFRPREKVFATDSLAEEDGFETLVALAKYVGLFRGKVLPK